MTGSAIEEVGHRGVVHVVGVAVELQPFADRDSRIDEELDGLHVRIAPALAQTLFGHQARADEGTYRGASPRATPREVSSDSEYSAVRLIKPSECSGRPMLPLTV